MTSEPVYTTPLHRIRRRRPSVRVMSRSQRQRPSSMAASAPCPTWTLRPTPSRRTPQTASRPWADQPGAPWSAPAALGSTRLLQTTALMGRHGKGMDGADQASLENRSDGYGLKINGTAILCRKRYVYFRLSFVFIRAFFCCFCAVFPWHRPILCHDMPHAKKYKRAVTPLGK